MPICGEIVFKKICPNPMFPEKIPIKIKDLNTTQVFHGEFVQNHQVFPGFSHETQVFPHVFPPRETVHGLALGQHHGAQLHRLPGNQTGTGAGPRELPSFFTEITSGLLVLFGDCW